MKYKIGDIVVIKENIYAGGAYGEVRMVESMLDYRGREAVITNVFDNGAYSLTVDYGTYLWTDDMLDPKTNFSSITECGRDKDNRLNVGDILMTEDGSECKVLAEINNIYLLSECDDFESTGIWNSLKEIQDNGWELLTEDEVDESIVYMTVDQVKDELGIKNLVIWE